MTWDEVNQGYKDARNRIRETDAIVGDMASMLVGRLRQAGVSRSVLAKLKRELRNFNIHTGRWNG